jgi:uncharacterized protein (DUF2336 family)
MSAAVLPDLSAGSNGAARDGSPKRDAQILSKVTDLLLSNVDRLGESRIAAFDDVLVPLIERTEARSLVHLSDVLSKMETAPRQAVRKLAFHNDALVAAPVLRESNCLSEKDLVEIAKGRGQQHLLAISDRRTLNETLTDTLLRLGDVNVSNALARNEGARFSECGYATLVGRAERDESLAEKLGLRLDIPASLLRELLEKAADVVRARFLTAPRPVAREKTAQSGSAAASRGPSIDYSGAQHLVSTLNRTGKLNDSVVNRFAVREEYANVVAALALITDVKIEAIAPLLDSDRLYGLIVACKAARLSWSTTAMIIRSRPGCSPATPWQLGQGMAVFETLALSVAQWTIRFGSDRILARMNERPASAASRNSPRPA